jgi:hypothetical protein
MPHHRVATAGRWNALRALAFIYDFGQLGIGRRDTISHRAHLCTGIPPTLRP